MTNDQLRYFLSLLKYGNINAAAESQYVNRISFTRSIQALENELQAKLYDRQRGRAKRVLLTPFGEYFIDYAKAILNLEAKRQADFASIALGQMPVVKIAVVPTLNLPLHQHYLIPFAKDHDDFSWYAMQSNVHEIEQAIFNEAAEFGFTSTELQNPNDFEILKEIPVNYCIICRQDTKWLNINKSYKLQDLAAVPFFLSPNSSKILYSRFHHMGITPRVVATNDVRGVSIFNALSDLGVALCPCAYPLDYPDLTTVTLDEPDIMGKHILFKSANHSLSPMAQKFIDYYMEHSQG